MYISRRNPKEELWTPINIHITHERLQIFFTKFVEWLDMHIKKPYALFLPIKGSKLITDPYGFISIDDFSKDDLRQLDPSHCSFVYQVPTDPATRKICQVDNEWIQSLRKEYEVQLKDTCTFITGDNVLFKETVYKNLRGVFQHHPDPVNPMYSTVALNMFSTQFLITLPSRYLEKYTDPEPNLISKLSMFFTANASFGTDPTDEEILD